MAYDKKCWDLAIHFLEDDTEHRQMAGDAARLAQSIQDAVEEFLSTLPLVLP